jgi:hypothetical protein
MIDAALAAPRSRLQVRPLPTRRMEILPMLDVDFSAPRVARC